MADEWSQYERKADSPALIPVKPQGDYTAKEPTAEDWSQFERTHAFEPSDVQRFVGHGLDRLGQTPSDIINTGKQFVANPGGTLIQMGKNLIGTPSRLINMYRNGQGPEATEELSEFALPLVSKGVGALLEKGAEPLAETAMHVGRKSRMFDANPGKAILEESSGVRPSSVAASLQRKGSDLGKQLEANAAKATAAGGTSSLIPGVTPVANRIAKAQGAGATATADSLIPMRDYFQGEAPTGFSGNTIPVPGGTPQIAPTQTPTQILQMRREFTPNFRIKYGPAADSTINNTGRAAYRGISDEVKRTVPGAIDIDPRLHNIMAALDPAESTALNAGLGQRIAGRFAAHTGALAGGLAGYHYGGLPGAVAGLAIPEIASSPTTQMIGARTLYGAGRALQKPALTIPLTISGKSLIQPDQER